LFSYISGILKDKNKDFIVVDVNGIGYKIFTAFSTFNNTPSIGSSVKLYTHLHVREDIMCLYGFLTRDELNVFELLIAVTGIGPRAAIAILSEVSPAKFSLAVITDDISTLTKAQGIGKKIAQRIILELKDKLKKENIQDIREGAISDLYDFDNINITGEAINALVVLGYTRNESTKVVNKVYNENMQLEILIKEALKALM